MTQEAAQRLRRAPSAAERDAWGALRTLQTQGVHVRRQHPIGRYVADFAIAKARIAIEIDGPFHSWPENLAHEKARTSYIENMGWRLIRFDWKTPPEQILATIRAALPLPSRGGGRGWGEAQPRPIAKQHLTRRTRANRVLPPRSND